MTRVTALQPKPSRATAEGGAKLGLNRRRALQVLTGLAVAGAIWGLPEAPARAGQDYQDLREQITRATTTIESMTRSDEFRELQALLPKARAVIILPQVIKGGFILGGKAGSGVLLVKGVDGTWSPPGFLTLAAGSIGLQIGGSVSQMVFTITNAFKFGGDIQVAAGTIGKGVEASTTSNLNADIYAYSDSVGLFGGGALEGAALITNKEANASYYRTPGVTMDDIVLARKYNNPDADILRSKLP